MATQTPNLNLTKPMGTDYVRIGDFNDNADKLDVSIGDLGQLTTDAKANLVLAINEAAQRGGENAPFIDVDTLHWMIWDFGTAQYVDSGVKAEGADGSNGADGISAFVWIKWSAIQPTQNSDMKDTPDQFIGVYSGTSPTAPTAYTSYQWYKYKGEKGDVGNPGTGNNWYVGTAISGTSLTPAVYPTDIPNALIGDMYLNNGELPDTGRAYVCTLGGNAATALWKYSCLLRGADGDGAGDMLTSVYDVDGDGIVDDAERLGGQLPAYYAKAADIPDISGKLDKAGDGKDVTAAFTAAGTRANIATGESLATLFGKLAKWFADFGAAAWLNVGSGASEVAAGNHLHGSIASDGKIGTTANLPVFTGTGGAVETKTAAAARNTLGLGNTTGALPVENGGTGAVDAAAARANLGAQAAMLAGTDYVVPPTQLTALPTSGTALTANAEYRVSATVGTYTFAWPSSPFEVWLKFTTAATFNIAFPAGTTYVGGAPTFKASTTYEMSVKDGVVIVQEVAA